MLSSIKSRTRAVFPPRRRLPLNVRIVKPFAVMGLSFGRAAIGRAALGRA
jgi:hypothetical protein